jgi:hypothetical protein
VYIYKVYFDSPGSHRGSNSSLNAEYVVIKNGDDVSHSISGWTVRDKAGHVYKFGSLSLGAGKQAIIHTGDGTRHTTSTSTHLCIGVGAGMCGTTLAGYICATSPHVTTSVEFVGEAPLQPVKLLELVRVQCHNRLGELAYRSQLVAEILVEGLEIAGPAQVAPRPRGFTH